MSDSTAETYPAGVVYFSSENATESRIEFTPDPTQKKLVIVSNCFARDRAAEETLELTVTQGSERLTTFGTTCSEDPGWGSIVPDLFRADGDKVIVEMDGDVAEDLAPRIIGFND